MFPDTKTTLESRKEIQQVDIRTQRGFFLRAKREAANKTRTETGYNKKGAQEDDDPKLCDTTRPAGTSDDVGDVVVQEADDDDGNVVVRGIRRHVNHPQVLLLGLARSAPSGDI